MPVFDHTLRRLAECGSIRTGQSFRKTVLEDPDSKHFVIQTRDLLPGGRVSTDLMPISTLTEKPKPNVQPDDVIIMSRGVRFNAGVIDQLYGPTTAQSMFYILTPEPHSGLLPQFIAAFLNDTSTQDRLKALAKGKTVPHLKIGDLGDLEIPLPPIDRQLAFVALADAMLEETRLLDRLKTLREQQLSAALRLLF